MKKINKFLFVLVLLVFSLFSSCKKGANDPFFSFYSRDARITADWKLSKIESSVTDISGATTTMTAVNYDGSVYTRFISVNGNPVITETKNGTYEMSIEKDGIMSWTETYINNGTPEVQSSTGYWRWQDSDKDKTSIYLEGGDVFFYAGSYRIDRLASKELVLLDEGHSNDNGNTQEWKKTITFEKK